MHYTIQTLPSFSTFTFVLEIIVCSMSVVFIVNVEFFVLKYAQDNTGSVVLIGTTLLCSASMFCSVFLLIENFKCFWIFFSKNYKLLLK